MPVTEEHPSTASPQTGTPVVLPGIMAAIDENSQTLDQPNDGDFVSIIDLALAVRESIIWASVIGLVPTKPRQADRAEEASNGRVQFEELMFSKIFSNALVAPDNSVIYAQIPFSIPQFCFSNDERKLKLFIDHVKELLFGTDIRQEKSLRREGYNSLSAIDFDHAEEIFHNLFQQVWQRTRPRKHEPQSPRDISFDPHIQGGPL